MTTAADTPYRPVMGWLVDMRNDSEAVVPVRVQARTARGAKQSARRQYPDLLLDSTREPVADTDS